MLNYLRPEPLSPWSNTWDLNLEQISYEPFGDRDDYEEDFNSYLAATIAYHWTYNTRNKSEWEATRGLLFDSAIKTGVADGWLLNWTNWAEWRRPVGRRWVWIAQGKIGLAPYDATDIGLSHRFDAGGISGIRGFRARGLGPVDAKSDDLHIGGSTELVLRNEIRYLLGDNFQVPLFFDIGTLDDNPLSFGGGVRSSVGIGLRFKLPGSSQQGYVYYAHNILREPTDDQQTLRFGFNVDF
jgi:outer membrane protein assembly factor BamA